MGGGFGALGLAGVLAEPSLAAGRRRRLESAGPPKLRTSRRKAKRVIFLFMNGGPSHVDTFDPKPMLAQVQRRAGPEGDQDQPERRQQADGFAVPVRKATAQSGIEVSELYPEVAGCIDDICVIRSMHTDIPNHEPALLDDELGADPADPAEPGLLADLRPGDREPEPARLTSSSAPASRWSARSSGATASCPASFKGRTSTTSRIDPKSIIAHLTNREPGRDPQRASSTCSSG